MLTLRSLVDSSVRTGFTLIELSIVLVIIGLIIGGVLVGRDLIGAATVRAQITQVEKYQAAINTFRSKYGYLPGDIPDPAATQYGFATRGQYAGEGDGNGIIQGIYADAPDSSYGSMATNGEAGMFWVDLAKANLIGGTFSTATPTTNNVNLTNLQVGLYFPPAALGQEAFVFVYSPPWGNQTTQNYFGVASFPNPNNGEVDNDAWGNLGGITVAQAYAIDNKIDDGLPMSGRVNSPIGGSSFGFVNGIVDNGPNFSSSTSCYDNGGVNGVVPHYSINQNGGAGLNCALSFRFQ